MYMYILIGHCGGQTRIRTGLPGFFTNVYPYPGYRVSRTEPTEVPVTGVHVQNSENFFAG